MLLFMYLKQDQLCRYAEKLTLKAESGKRKDYQPVGAVSVELLD
jgi:hypothetical protein